MGLGGLGQGSLCPPAPRVHPGVLRPPDPLHSGGLRPPRTPLKGLHPPKVWPTSSSTLWADISIPVVLFPISRIGK